MTNQQKNQQSSNPLIDQSCTYIPFSRDDEQQDIREEVTVEMCLATIDYMMREWVNYDVNAVLIRMNKEAREDFILHARKIAIENKTKFLTEAAA